MENRHIASDQISGTPAHPNAADRAPRARNGKPEPIRQSKIRHALDELRHQRLAFGIIRGILPLERSVRLLAVANGGIDVHVSLFEVKPAPFLGHADRQHDVLNRWFGFGKVLKQKNSKPKRESARCVTSTTSSVVDARLRFSMASYASRKKPILVPGMRTPLSRSQESTAVATTGVDSTQKSGSGGWPRQSESISHSRRNALAYLDRRRTRQQEGPGNDRSGARHRIASAPASPTTSKRFGCRSRPIAPSSGRRG